MDPQTEMILQMLSAVRSDMAAGFTGVHERLDALNGRTRKNSEAIAVLDERTANMTCVEHSERFKSLEKTVELIELSGARPTRAQQAKQIAITGGSVAALLAIIEGMVKWIQRAQ
jgi:hypothetical protein